MEEIHYDKFCDIFFRIAVDYLGMNSRILCNRTCKECPDDVIDDFMRVGKVDDNDEDSWKIMHLLMPYYMQEKEVPKSSWKRIKYIIFPSVEELTENYQYVKKAGRILLPVAWVHRIINRFIVGIRKEKEPGVLIKSKKLNHRLKLLNEVGLTK